MKLYSNAAKEVITVRESRQAELDADASAARAAHIIAARKALSEMVSEGDPGYSVAQFLSIDVQIGRTNDGYPQIKYSDEAENLVLALADAGTSLPVVKNYNGFAVSHEPLPGEWRTAREEDYAAWDKATEYRKKNIRTF